MQTLYGGGVQVLLRHYAEIMLNDMQKKLNFSVLTASQTSDALTHWLQNVANLSLSLRNEDLTAFCDRHKIENDDVIRMADKLDINVAFLDDILSHDGRMMRRG